MTPQEEADRLKRLEEAMKRRKASTSTHTPIEVPDIEYLVLGQDNCKVFRVVGSTPETRKEPWDTAKVMKSLILDDAGNYFNLIWNNDDRHPMWKLYRKLTKHQWDKEARRAIYDYEGCDLLNRFLTNNQDTSFTSGMTPQTYILMNVIDRADSWCKDNKHTKILAWDSNLSKDGKSYPVPGIKNSLFKQMFDVKCAEVRRNLDELDFVVRRFSQKSRPNKDTNYKVYWQEEKTAIENWEIKDKKQYYKLINPDYFLTDEEKKYGKYDLDNIPYVSSPTPTFVIMKRLEAFIKEIDSKYHWGLWEEFETWKEKEDEAWKAKNTTGDSSKDSSHSDSESYGESDDLPGEAEVHTHQVPQSPKVKETKEKVEKVKSRFSAEELALFPYLSKLKPDDIKLIKEVDVDGQEIIWNVNEDDISSCANNDCGIDLPDDLSICPLCGTEY